VPTTVVAPTGPTPCSQFPHCAGGPAPTGRLALPAYQPAGGRRLPELPPVGRAAQSHRTAIRCILHVEFKCGGWPMQNPLRLVKWFLLPPVDVTQLRSAITGPCLIVVSPARPDVFEYLQHQLAGHERVEVVLDSRSGWGRRRTHERQHMSQRRGDRRQPPSVANDLTLGDFRDCSAAGHGGAHSHDERVNRSHRARLNNSALWSSRRTDRAVTSGALGAR
jgi:hypothetical protein